MVFSVKTYNNINQIGLKELGNHFQIDGDLAKKLDAYIIRSQNLHDTVFPDNLKAIARAGAGTNNIPVDEATEKGIVVFNTPGANANAVKEAVLASILLSARDYIAATLKLIPCLVMIFLNKSKQVRSSLLVARLLEKPLVLSGLVLSVLVLPMMPIVWV